MDDDSRRKLRRELGRAVPKGLEPLTSEEARDLAAALREARERQSAALQKALQEALGHIPRLLRGPVRRILLG